MHVKNQEDAPPQSMQPSSVKAKRMRFAFEDVVSLLMVLWPSFASAWTREKACWRSDKRTWHVPASKHGAAHSSPEGSLDWRCMP